MVRRYALLAASLAVALALCTASGTAEAQTVQDDYARVEGVSQLDGPYGIATSGTGYYVADQGGHCVRGFVGGSLTGTWGGTSVGTDPDHANQFFTPIGIAVDASGVYVADNGANVVWKYNGSTRTLLRGGVPGTALGELRGPTGIAVFNNEVYVCDTGNDRIQVFGTDGSYKRAWGGTGSGQTQFRQPVGIAVSGAGRVYVVQMGRLYPEGSAQEPGVKVFTTAGVPVDLKDINGDPTGTNQVIGKGTADSQFNSPCGISANSSGEIYVADTGNDRIQVFDAEMNLIRQFGATGTGAGLFNAPVGIAHNGAWTYIVEYGNKRVQVFERKVLP